MPEPARVVVVGGGISGVAAAWFLRQELGDDARITVAEQRPTLGGHLRVSDVAGLPVDEGAESLLARRPEAVGLARDVGLGDDLTEPAAVGAGIHSRGRMHPMPDRTVMGVPAEPAALSGLLTADEITVAEEADQDNRPGLPLDSDVAIGRVVAARMGRAVVDRVVEPLLGGVYAGHAADLSLDATVPALGAAARRTTTLRAAVEDVRRDTPDTSGPAFAGLTGGVGRLPGAVAQAARADVRTGVTVRELHRATHGWRLVTGPVPAPEEWRADAVVLAVPPAPAARLLGDTARSAAADLAGIETASMAVVTLALPRSAFPTPPASSGFLIPPVDGHVVKAVTYSSVKWPWLGKRAGDLVLVRASIGRHREEYVLQRDDGELEQTVLDELATMAGVRGRPVDARITRWGGALPQYTVGHVDRVRRIRAAVATRPGLAVCGAAMDGVGVAACVGAAADAARRVVADLRERHVRIGL